MPSSVSRNFPQRLDAADDEQKIVLAFQCEHRIDEIVPRALLAQLDFEAVGEEEAEDRTESSKFQSITRALIPR